MPDTKATDVHPPKRQYTQINTDEIEALIADNAKLKAMIEQHSDVVIAEWEALKAENVRLREAAQWDEEELVTEAYWPILHALEQVGWGKPQDAGIVAHEVIAKLKPLLPPKPEGEPDA